MVINFSIVPIGKESSLSAQVAEILEIVSESRISYRLHAMGTVVLVHRESEFSKFKISCFIIGASPQTTSHQ